MAEVQEKKREQPAGAPIDPNKDAIAYLQAKGWKCLGNPEWASALWLDPTQPLVAFSTREKIMYTTSIPEEYIDADGRRRTRFKQEERQILAQTGDGGALQGATREVYHPAVVPVSVSYALMVQMERDAMETTKKEQDRVKEQQRKTA